MDDYRRELLKFRDPEEHCPCGWRGLYSGLNRGKEFEVMHPKNEHLRRVVDNPPDRVEAYLTSYEACPNCGRWLYADGQPLLSSKRVPIPAPR